MLYNNDMKIYHIVACGVAGSSEEPWMMSQGHKLWLLSVS